MRLQFTLLAIVSFSCSRTEQTKVGESEPISDTISVTQQTQNECVFNNDYLQLTREWLTELKIDNFTWDDLNDRAAILSGQDTIYLTKGGCTHFEISVEQAVVGDGHSLSDSIYWINKSLSLAQRFGFDFYVKSITNGNVIFVQHDPDDGEIWFHVNDDDHEDNLLYNGINVLEKNGVKTIWISMYYN